MKKRNILLASVLSLLVLLTALLTACGGGEQTYHNIAAQDNPYSMGTQSILIKAGSANADEPSARFKQSISPADIELGQALEGKTVTNVVFHDETSVTVTLAGDTKVAGGEGVYGTITVKHSGLDSEGSSSCTVNVRAPELTVTSYSASRKTTGDVTTHTLIAKLSLPAGSFTDRAAECVTLAGDATGELTAEYADGILTLTIRGCNTAHPSVTLSADATSFAREITVRLALGGGAQIG